MKVTWTAVSNASGYKIYYRKKGTSPWKSKTVSSSKTSATISSLNRKTTYQVRMRAYVKTGVGKVWSKYSSKVKATTK